MDINEYKSFLTHVFASDFEQTSPEEYAAYYKQDRYGKMGLYISHDNMRKFFFDNKFQLEDINLPVTVSLHNIRPREHDIQKHILIVNCSNLHLDIYDSNFQHITIKDSQVDKLEIRKSVIGNLGLDIYNDTLYASDEKQATGHQDITLQNAEILGRVRIFNVPNIKKLHFESCVFRLSTLHQDQKINNNIIIDHIDMDVFMITGHKTSIVEGIVVKDAGFKVFSVNTKYHEFTGVINSLSISQARKIADLELKHTQFSKIAFSSCHEVDSIQVSEISIQDTPESNFELSDCTCKKVFINHVSKGGKIAISHCSITNGNIGYSDFRELVLSGLFYHTGMLVVEHNQFDNIRFLDFTNAGYVYFKDIRAGQGAGDKLFEVVYSDLGKVHFIDCILKDAWKIRFENSKILDAFIIGSEFSRHWVEPRAQNPNDHEEKKALLEKTLRQKRYMHGQLVRIYENSGDRVRALSNKTESLKSYHDLLTHKRNKSVKERWDLISLRMNKYSSGFDYNLSRGFWMMMAVSFGLFWLYVLFLNHYTFAWPVTGPSIKTFFSILAHWFIFISPIHDVNFLHNYPSDKVIVATVPARIIDGFSRIVVGYLIYQFIQAFRKFGRE